MASLGLRRHASGCGAPPACLPSWRHRFPTADGWRWSCPVRTTDVLGAPCSLPPDSASTPTSGAVGVSGDCRYGISPALSSSACNALPAFAGGIHLLAHVPCLHIRVANPQHYLLRTLLTLCAAQCSIQLLISSHILSLVYFPLSIAAPTLPRCASIHPWMRLHGWRFPLL